MKNFIKNFYETVNVPDTLNTAILELDGAHTIVLVPGAAV